MFNIYSIMYKTRIDILSNNNKLTADNYSQGNVTWFINDCTAL